MEGFGDVFVIFRIFHLQLRLTMSFLFVLQAKRGGKVFARMQNRCGGGAAGAERRGRRRRRGR